MSKFLLRLGINPPEDVRPASLRYQQWLRGLTWEHAAQQLVFSEYRQSFEEIEQRITRLEREIATAVQASPHSTTIAALQAMRGIKLSTFCGAVGNAAGNALVEPIRETVY